MVVPLRRRVWRAANERKGLHLGIILLLLLGSFYFTMASGVSDNLENMVVEFSDANRQEDLTFSTHEPITDVAAIESESRALIEPVRQCDVKVPGGQLRLLSSGSKVDLPAVTSGRGLERPGDILLDPSFSRTHGLDPGSRIEIHGTFFTVVGTMATPDYVYIIKNQYDVLPTSDFGIGIVSGADLDAFPETVTIYSARFEDRRDLNAQTAKLHRLLSDQGHSISEWLDRKSNKRISMPWANISSMKSMSFPVSVAFFLLGGLIVGVTSRRMVKSDRVVIGTLYAQGYRRGELMRHALALPMLLSAIGGLSGTLIALPCVGPVVSAMLTSYVLPARSITFSPLNLALAVLMPLALVGLSSFLVMREILGKSAVDLMKGDEQKARVSFVERALRLDRFQFNTKFRIREQARSIPRLLFLVLGVSAASTTALYGLMYGYSMDTMMDRGALARYVYPLEYNFKEARRLKDGALPAGAEPYSALRCYPEGRESVEFYLVGMKPDSVGFKVNDLHGDALSRDQVNISSPLANRLGLAKGETIELVDKLSGKSYSLKIDGIVEAYGEQFVFMPLDEFNRLTGQPLGTYRTVLSSHELNFDENLLAGVMDARNREAYADLSKPTKLIVASVTALAVLIAVIVIFLVTSLIIDESRSTISLFKVFGYRGKELERLILNSSTPAVFVGFWLGLPFALAFGNGISDYVAETINMLIPMIVNPLHVLMSFGLILAVYELTKRRCGTKIDKIPMSEALKAGSE